MMKNVMRRYAIYDGRKVFVVRIAKAIMSSKMDTTRTKFAANDIAAAIVIVVLMISRVLFLEGIISHCEFGCCALISWG